MLPRLIKQKSYAASDKKKKLEGTIQKRLCRFSSGYFNIKGVCCGCRSITKKVDEIIAEVSRNNM